MLQKWIKIGCRTEAPDQFLNFVIFDMTINNYYQRKVENSENMQLQNYECNT